MSITVKYFAVLRERYGRASDTVEFVAGMTAAEAWQKALPDQPLPDNIKVAVNMEYSRRDTRLNDGDEVAFFPSVTGG